MNGKEEQSVDIFGAFGEGIGALVGYYILINIPSWNLSFITEAFLRYQPIGINALLLSAGAKIIMHIVGNMHIKRLMMLISHIISIISLYYLVTIFPFDFSSVQGFGMMNSILGILLVIAIFGTGVAVIIQLLRLALGLGGAL